MQLTQGNLARLYTGLQAALLAGVAEAPIPEDVKDFAAEVPSGKSSEHYPTAAMLGDLEELLDQYTYLNIAEFIQEVQNRYFGRILRIPRAKIEDEDLGMHTMTMGRFGRLAGVFPYRLIPQLFINGFTNAWIDGANIFSNAHTWPGGQTWSNITIGPLNVVNYRRARIKLRTRPAPDGQIIGRAPTHLIVGPTNEAMAKVIVAAEYIAPGVFNPDFDSNVKITVWNALTGVYAGWWFLVDASDLKPIIIQNRDAPALTAKTGATDLNVFMQETYEYKVSRRFGQEIVLPHLIEASQWGAEGVTTTTAA